MELQLSSHPLPPPTDTLLHSLVLLSPPGDFPLKTHANGAIIIGYLACRCFFQKKKDENSSEKVKICKSSVQCLGWNHLTIYDTQKH